MLCKRRATWRVLGLILGACSALLWAALPVSADGVKSRGATEADSDAPKGFTFESNISFSTDYRFRGFTQTREGPAIQGGFDITYQWFYAGIWSSNVDFGRVPDAFGRLRRVAEAEVEFYAGLKNKIRGVTVDVGAIYYAYPGSFGFPEDLDYYEVKGGISGEIHKDLTLGVNIYYSPDYFGEVGRNWVFEGFWKRNLPSFAGLQPSISGTLAYNSGEESKGGIDYWYWNAGISFVFADYFELDLRYFDTIDVPGHIDCSQRCDGRFVARLTFEY
jgi:uncharacterized protein (TIGR02001 family)